MERKIKKFVSSFFIALLIIATTFLSSGFGNNAVAAICEEAAVQSLWNNVQNGNIPIEFALECLYQETTVVYPDGTTMLPQSELEKAINNGCFVDYIDYFKANGCISQDFVYTPTSSSGSGSTSGSTTTKKEYTEEEIAAAWKETSRTEATCLEAGVINYKNSLTGEKKTEEIKALGHNYEVVTEVATTCETSGLDIYTCLACGDSFEQQTPALGHSFTVTSKTEATCTTAGSVVAVCDTCGMEQSEVIDATGHTEGFDTIVKEATLFGAGEKAVFCTVCDEKLSSEVIPATCPVPLGAIVSVIAFVVVASVVVVKRKKQSNNESE